MMAQLALERERRLVELDAEWRRKVAREEMLELERKAREDAMAATEAEAQVRGRRRERERRGVFEEREDRVRGLCFWRVLREGGCDCSAISLDLARAPFRCLLHKAWAPQCAMWAVLRPGCRLRFLADGPDGPTVRNAGKGG